MSPTGRVEHQQGRGRAWRPRAPPRQDGGGAYIVFFCWRARVSEEKREDAGGITNRLHGVHARLERSGASSASVTVDGRRGWLCVAMGAGGGGGAAGTRRAGPAETDAAAAGRSTGGLEEEREKAVAREEAVAGDAARLRTVDGLWGAKDEMRCNPASGPGACFRADNAKPSPRIGRRELHAGRVRHPAPPPSRPPAIPLPAPFRRAIEAG